MPAVPTLHVIAGVNGAGKTSFYRYVLADMTPGAEFVNADDFARETWPGAESEHTEEAARRTIERRVRLMGFRQTFVTETVFSHESKLELVREAKERGYRVILYHLGVDSAELARARVATRVETGGHDVPEEKVDARYVRTQDLIPRAAALADTTMVFDNSGCGGTATHRFVLRIEQGQVVTRSPDPLPEWVREAYDELLREAG